MSGLAAIGYIAFPAFALGPTAAPAPSLKSAAPHRFPAPSDPSRPLTNPGVGQTNEAIDPLLDEAVDTVAAGSVEMTSALSARIAKLAASAPPQGREWMIALTNRLAAAAAAGDVDEARRLVQVYRLVHSAAEGASICRRLDALSNTGFLGFSLMHNSLTNIRKPV